HVGPFAAAVGDDEAESAPVIPVGDAPRHSDHDASSTTRSASADAGLHGYTFLQCLSSDAAIRSERMSKARQAPQAIFAPRNPTPPPPDRQSRDRRATTPVDAESTWTQSSLPFAHPNMKKPRRSGAFSGST